MEKLQNNIAQKKIQNSDIIVDQLLIGSFGTLAVEGMGYGKPVICYLLEDIKEDIFSDCPIYVAKIDNIEQKLETLIINEYLRIELGQKGIKFVKKYFDNKKFLKKWKNL